MAGDIHDDVAARIRAAGLRPVLDVGRGDGHLGRLLPARWPLVGVDFSPTQLRHAQPGLLVQGDAARLPSLDAEEAEEIVASVFEPASVTVVRWDAPLVRLADREAVVRYLRSHWLAAEIADRVDAPITLTKRGCLVIARRER